MERISMKLNKKSVNLNEETMRALIDYEWPGNVRELENIIELMVNTESIPDSLMKGQGHSQGKAADSEGGFNAELTEGVEEENMNLSDIEKKYILKVLALQNWNITQCAKILGIGRNTLYRKMESYGIACSEMEHRSIM